MELTLSPTDKITPSFAQATSRIRHAFAGMTQETEPMQHILRDKVLLHNHWKVERADDNGKGKWLSFHHYTAFAKGLVIDYSDSDRYRSLISEKFLCDLAYDLGLPHACCAFQRVSGKKGDYPSLISLVPFQGAASLDRIMDLPTNEALNAILKDRPALIDAFLALSLFDAWCGNTDRFKGNLLSDATAINLNQGKHQNDITWINPPTVLVGIDLEINMIVLKMNPDISHLRQADAFCTYATPEHKDIISATVNAIEQFPEERIAVTANRLKCLAPKLWNAQRAIRIMTSRQFTLRPMLDAALGTARRFELGL